jgi:multidrug efflux pump subunit AcrB
MEPQEPTLSMMTLKKYKTVKQHIEQNYGTEACDDICHKICEVFKFDPVIGNSSKQKTQKVIEWREKKAKELGVTPNDIRKGLKKLLAARNEEGGKST